MTADPKAVDVEGRIVLIGTSAAGLKDIRSTAPNPVAAGVEIQAQALEQMILGEHLLRPDWTIREGEVHGVLVKNVESLHVEQPELRLSAVEGVRVILVRHRSRTIASVQHVEVVSSARHTAIGLDGFESDSVSL